MASTPRVLVDTEQTPRFHRWKWTVLLAAMVMYLFMYTGRQAFGFAIPGIQREYGIDKATLGTISGIGLWAYAAGQFINGGLADRFGGRRLGGIGAIGSTALNWLLSAAGSAAGIGVCWAANGLFQAMGWPSGSRVISQWWKSHERGKAFSLYTFAAGMASIVAYLTSVLVLDIFDLDWRWIFRGPVLLMLLGGTLFLLLARDRPRDCGFEDAEPDANTVHGQSVPGDDGQSIWAKYAGVLRVPGIWIAGCAIGFQNAARYALLIWVPVYFLGEKASSGSLWVTVALPAGMAVGALSNGFVSDKIFRSRRWPAISTYMLLAMLASLAMYLLPRGSVFGIVLLFATGFLVYGPQSSFWALCPDLVGAARGATAIGVVDCFAYVFAGFEEPVVGYIMDVTGETSLVFIIVAVSCAVGGLIAIAIRR